MSRIAIVGAGAAGLAAAYGLRTVTDEITVFEKSRGFGGRAATRGRHGCRYDHGANYITVTSDRVERLLAAHLPTEDLVRIGRPIWSFDATGAISRGREDDLNRTSKWTYRHGINTLGKLLARHGPAEVKRETRITEIAHEGVWRLQDREGDRYGPFDVLLLTPPAPQTAALLATASSEVARRVQRNVDDVSYAAQFAYIFAYGRTVARPGRFYGLVSEDEGHPLRWIGFEHDKPGHVPEGESVLVAQTGPNWTAERVDEDPESYADDIRNHMEEILVADLRQPSWYDVQRWRYAVPEEGLPPDQRPEGGTIGLFLAGDYVGGNGSVETALETGLDAALRITDWMER
jgi:predicted NAD/FAD-dependent oxidoreductase